MTTEMTTYEWITTFLVPITGIVSWLAGARMRKNSAIKAMQTIIDMLVEQNADLYKKSAGASEGKRQPARRCHQA